MTSPIPEDSPWRSEREAAAHIRHSQHALVCWRKQGVGPRHIRTAGGRILYHVDWLNEWVADQVAKAGTAA